MEQIGEFYVYEHRRADDGAVFYVGKGRRRRAWSRNGRNEYWWRTVSKHGLTVEILTDASDLTEPEAHRVERELIAHHRYHGAVLTNLTDGGDGASGYIHTDSTRAKMSATKRGVPLSEEHRARMSEALRGVPKSEDHKATLRGENNPAKREEVREKLRGEKNPMFGRCGERGPSYKPERLLFEYVATGERHELTRTAARERLGLRKSGISNLISGHRKTSRGYRIVSRDT